MSESTAPNCLTLPGGAPRARQCLPRHSVAGVPESAMSESAIQSGGLPS